MSEIFLGAHRDILDVRWFAWNPIDPLCIVLMSSSFNFRQTRETGSVLLPPARLKNNNAIWSFQKWKNDMRVYLHTERGGEIK